MNSIRLPETQSLVLLDRRPRFENTSSIFLNVGQTFTTTQTQEQATHALLVVDRDAGRQIVQPDQIRQGDFVFGWVHVIE